MADGTIGDIWRKKASELGRGLILTTGVAASAVTATGCTQQPSDFVHRTPQPPLSRAHGPWLFDASAEARTEAVYAHDVGTIRDERSAGNTVSDSHLPRTLLRSHAETQAFDQLLKAYDAAHSSALAVGNSQESMKSFGHAVQRIMPRLNKQEQTNVTGVFVYRMLTRGNNGISGIAYLRAYWPPSGNLHLLDLDQQRKTPEQMATDGLMLGLNSDQLTFIDQGAYVVTKGGVEAAKSLEDRTRDAKTVAAHDPQYKVLTVSLPEQDRGRKF